MIGAAIGLVLFAAAVAVVLPIVSCRRWHARYHRDFHVMCDHCVNQRYP